MKLNRKNEISLMGYKGKDVFSVNRTFGIEYGNDLVSLKWKHSRNENHFSNTVFSYSNYSYDINIKNSNSNLLILASIKNASVRYENQIIKNEHHQFKFGFDVLLHEIKPSSIIANDGSSYNTVDMDIRRNFEANMFISHHWKISDKLVLDYGLRVNSFSILGPGNYINYDSFGNPTKFLSYKLYQISVPYITPEPRFSANYELSKYKYLKFSYTRNAQNIHQVSNSTSASPTDLFMSSNNNLKPEIADQVSAGYFSNVDESRYEFSAELYYKQLQNQLDFRNGSQLIANQQFEKQLIFGIGRAYGLEVLLKKKTGKLTGWIGYTLSRTERKFNAINYNQWFKARQDRLHEVSIVGTYQLSKRIVFSSVWVYYSGCPVTLPVGIYTISGQNAYYYTERNGSKMPDYHRLDLSLTLDGKKRKNYEDSWTFSIFNAYNRENAYSIDFQADMSNNGKVIVTQTTLFKLVPSIIYNFKF
jgi:outer membrane receptor protein involved in Fe transport